MLTLHPVLPVRAAIVAGVAAALGLLALANLSTSAPPSAGEAQKQSFRAPRAAPIAYSFAVLSRVDGFSR